jgi:cob(I)alamin adenosyltransferase
MPKVYTRKGDRGITKICEKHMRKTHPCIHFLGSLDEAMSFVGLALENVNSKTIQEGLKLIYEYLSKIAGALATGWCPSEEDVRKIERLIDDAPKPNGFIPNYNLEKPGVAYLAVVRATIRRAERWFWACVNTEDLYCSNIGKLLNRLSDYAFILQYLQHIQ